MGNSNAAHNNSCHSPTPLVFPDFISVDLETEGSGVFYCCIWSNVQEGGWDSCVFFFLSGISFNLDESSAEQEAVDLATEKSKLCYENKHTQPMWSCP